MSCCLCTQAEQKNKIHNEAVLEGNLFLTVFRADLPAAPSVQQVMAHAEKQIMGPEGKKKKATVHEIKSMIVALNKRVIGTTRAAVVAQLASLLAGTVLVVFPHFPTLFHAAEP